MNGLFKTIPGAKIIRNEFLCKHTSFHIGGKADYFISVFTKKALKKVLEIINSRNLRYFIIGAGTNLLVKDEGFRGVVIKLGGIFKRMYNKNNYFYCGAGLMVKDFLEKTTRLEYGGAEFLAGIPGTTGGAVKGNAGAFGHAIAEITESIIVINTQQVEKELCREKINFIYRGSNIKDDQIIIKIKFRLVKKTKSRIKAAINKNLKHRWHKQPAGFSAGSFFKNPPGQAAGKLIEACGLKGLTVGDAVVSFKHANYIINRGHAKASDVVALAKMIKRIVRERKGISLTEEVRLLN